MKKNSRVVSVDSNVIYVNFERPKHYKSNNKKKLSGVFIKPCGVDESLYMIGGNLSGFVASYIAFHPEFSVGLFGSQVREELGISLNDDDEPTPTTPQPKQKRLVA